MWRKTFHWFEKSCMCHLLNADCKAHSPTNQPTHAIRFLLRKSTTIDHIGHSMRLISKTCLWKYYSLAGNIENFIIWESVTPAKALYSQSWCAESFVVTIVRSFVWSFVTQRHTYTVYSLCPANIQFSTFHWPWLKWLELISLRIFTWAFFILLFIWKLHGATRMRLMRHFK